MAATSEAAYENDVIWFKFPEVTVGEPINTQIPSKRSVDATFHLSEGMDAFRAPLHPLRSYLAYLNLKMQKAF